MNFTFSVDPSYGHVACAAPRRRSSKRSFAFQQQCKFHSETLAFWHDGSCLGDALDRTVAKRRCHKLDPCSEGSSRSGAGRPSLSATCLDGMHRPPHRPQHTPHRRHPHLGHHHPPSPRNVPDASEHEEAWWEEWRECGSAIRGLRRDRISPDNRCKRMMDLRMTGKAASHLGWRCL